MQIRLNTWQTLLLFLPFLIGQIIVLQLPNNNLYNYQTHFAIANFLDVINVLIVIWYQANLVFNFDRLEEIRSKLLRWNALIPVIFITVYFFYVFYLTFIKPQIHAPNYVPGPIKKAYFTTSYTILFVFLLHAFVTFYFINNNIVYRRIKNISDPFEREKMWSLFALPMKRLIRYSLLVFLIVLLVSVVFDIIRFKNIR